MINLFRRFRHWRMERYYANTLQVKFLAWCELLPATQDLYTMKELKQFALNDTREHFNDHTFQPRTK